MVSRKKQKISFLPNLNTIVKSLQLPLQYNLKLQKPYPLNETIQRVDITQEEVSSKVNLILLNHQIVLFLKIE